MSPVFAPARAGAATGILAGRAYSGAPDRIRLSNDLVRIVGQMSIPSFQMEFWDGSAWRAKAIDVWKDLIPLTFDKASLLQYRREVGVAQYEASLSAGGRVTVDVTLRPGMRVAIFQVSHNQSVSLSASPNPTQAMTKTNERQVSNAGDAQGHKLVIGSPRTWTQTAGTGLLSKAATKTLTFYAGLELSGVTSGDTALDLSMQAIGVLNESVRVARR
jgi:hypothetical protein